MPRSRLATPKDTERLPGELGSPTAQAGVLAMTSPHLGALMERAGRFPRPRRMAAPEFWLGGRPSGSSMPAGAGGGAHSSILVERLAACASARLEPSFQEFISASP